MQQVMTLEEVNEIVLECKKGLDNLYASASPKLKRHKSASMGDQFSTLPRQFHLKDITIEVSI